MPANDALKRSCPDAKVTFVTPLQARPLRSTFCFAVSVRSPATLHSIHFPAGSAACWTQATPPARVSATVTLLRDPSPDPSRRSMSAGHAPSWQLLERRRSLAIWGATSRWKALPLALSHWSPPSFPLRVPFQKLRPACSSLAGRLTPPPKKPWLPTFVGLSSYFPRPYEIET